MTGFMWGSFEDAPELEVPSPSDKMMVGVAIDDLAKILAENVRLEARVEELLAANNKLVEEVRALKALRGGGQIWAGPALPAPALPDWLRGAQIGPGVMPGAITID